ncbi:hypothetical protein J2P12_00670 [Candidatus Bathyarchaeota archaeon]|nr:hypothetical protein [Candidatus Bathyarchaeota archaeon]
MSTTPMGSPDTGFLVGDVIMDMRSAGPDPPQVLGTPVFITAVSAGGGTLAAGTYYLVVTALNAWGESAASNELSVTLAVPGSINITFLIPFGSNGNFKLYIGGSSGMENGYVGFTASGTPGTFSLTSLAGAIAGAPPARSTSWLPDTDGGFVSASLAYRWLNESLRTISKMAGGVQDVTGIASISGQRRYQVNGQWLKFDHCFYDGWEMDQGTKAEVFYNRNITANIAISILADARSDKTRVELYWTPSRTSGVATTGATLNSGDLNVTLVAPAVGWLLGDGYAQVGSEIISYSAITATQLQNISRGWGGTSTPASLASPASVNELNIMLFGYRQPSTYPVGSSASVVNVPGEWQTALNLYMLAKFRAAEQEMQESQVLAKQAEAYVKENCMTNRQLVGPRQCRIWDDRGIRGVVPGGLTGGIIIP